MIDKETAWKVFTKIIIEFLKDKPIVTCGESLKGQLARGYTYYGLDAELLIPLTDLFEQYYPSSGVDPDIPLFKGQLSIKDTRARHEFNRKMLDLQYPKLLEAYRKVNKACGVKEAKDVPEDMKKVWRTDMDRAEAEVKKKFPAWQKGMKIENLTEEGYKA